MPSTDPTRTEDRADFEQVLEQGLNSPRITEALRTHTAVSADRLRAWALESRAAIAAAAIPEYRAYLEARSARHRGTPSPLGNGLGALAVLLPALAAAAAAVFLVLGYGFRLLGVQARLAHGLQAAGWMAVAVATAAVLLGVVGVLVIAVRNRTSRPAASGGERVAEARAAWQRALLERGVLPFLRHQIEEADRQPE
ncbi:hypothetical protein [Streptomyces huiliensis]|uniref:hypothetical protein n=1 Tax=Streptomyces huiliensis TaxID=2876027 RepID=UPI001CBACBFC|nr:hypothetical protein [Streptomyces huiliensis]MBZ4322885.1 hypothetical protein [Streptomyces huiliensis]